MARYSVHPFNGVFNVHNLGGHIVAGPFACDGQARDYIKDLIAAQKGAPATIKRACMRCNADVHSTGFGHRLCKYCRQLGREAMV